MQSFSEGIYNRKLQAVPASDFICVYALSAGSAHKAIPVPDGANVAVLTASADVALKFGNGAVAASLPTGASHAGAASDLCPANGKIPFNVLAGATHLSLIAAADVYVTVAWYAA